MAVSRMTIDSLPIELLSYILVLATHGSRPADGLAFTSQSVAVPLVLGSVNHHWRSVALTTPALWTSLCATLDSLVVSPDRTSTSFDTTHLTSYLRLSRQYPLDLVIDARDELWDYSEPEIVSEFEFSTYSPPFSTTHMTTVLALLMPHLHRWRSAVILTDTWAPMHTALIHLNAQLNKCGAPILESLTLMRCNEYVSHVPEFQPRQFRFPAFLSGVQTDTDLFPRLATLSLHGVHADWKSLATALQSSASRMRELELAFLSSDVRPSSGDFCGILEACPNLTRLAVVGAGPILPYVPVGDEEQCIILPPLSLPHLEELEIGYRSMLDGGKLPELINAPNIKKLVLEDATHPGDPFVVNATGILSFLATGVRQNHVENLTIAYLTPNSSSIRETKINVSLAATSLPESSSFAPSVPFPLLEDVALKRVKATPKAFQALLHSLPLLETLELCEVPLCAVQALSPVPDVTCPPCPKLRSLSVRGFERSQLKQVNSVFMTMTTERRRCGATSLAEVDVYVEGNDDLLLGEDAALLAHSCGKDTRARLREISAPPCTFEYDDGDEDAAFELGGAFNDPLFDAFYSSPQQTVFW